MIYNKYVGYAGLIILMVTVTLNGDFQRALWLVSAILLFVYSAFNLDLINSFVNLWIAGVNIFYLVG